MNKKQKIASLIEKQKAIRDAAKAESREFTDEEQTEFNSLQRKIDELKDTPDEPEQSDNQRKIAIQNERQRISEITSLCREFNIDAQKFINDGSSIDQVREAVLQEIRNGQSGIRTSGTLNVENDEETKFRAAATDALVLKAGQAVDKPAEGAGELRSMSLRDLAIECISRSGESGVNSLLRMSSSELYDHATRAFYNPTAAFPAILDASIKKSIVDIYKKVPTTYDLWTSKGSLSDFKETKDHEYLIGSTDDFVKVPENGELKNSVPQTELLPSRKLDTYGRQFSMTRQAFINDDIGFLTRVPGLYARKSKLTIDKQVYSVIFNNSKIFDGVNLFDDKAHGNIISSGTAPSVDAIQKMIKKLMLMKDPFGDPIYVTPKYIVVPVGYAMDLKVIIHSTNLPGSNNNDINPLYNEVFEVIETPMLNALADSNAIPWFIIADPLTAKSIQVDFLDGNEEPTIRRSEQPGTLGFVWDIWHDWGISVVDYRGIVRNDGVKMS